MFNTLYLGRQYDVVTDEKVHTLAVKIWDALNEVDYDPLHPSFDSFDDPVRDKVIAYAEDILRGFPSCDPSDA